MAKILMVEDSAQLREAVSDFFMNRSGGTLTVETAADGDEGMNAVMNNTYDLVILDIKHIDEEKHRALTGHTNANILAMAEYLSDLGKPLWIRHVLVPGISFSGEDRSDLYRLREFIDTLHTVERVEVLPYHRMGIPKWEKLGIPYSLAETPVPTGEEIQRAESILCR